MHSVLIGFLSGALSGIVMGLTSHALFRLGLFKSSLIVVDGAFLFRTLGHQAGPSLVNGVGLVIHLLTSGVFGALYFAAAALLGLSTATTMSCSLVSLYVALLWLSMLFIALPVAGEGFLGKRSGRLSWLEQLVLHLIFFAFYYGCLKAFL